MARYARLAAFIIVVLGAGFAIGTTNLPGAWYGGLHKPPFNPPDWVFAPVWSVVYVLIAMAGWRSWERAPRSSAMALWATQMVLNFMWSPVFFTAHWTGLALVIIMTMFVAIMSFVASQWRTDRVAAWLFVPYAVWVAFATLLNASIFALN